jgi:uncharacterized protein (TIGR03000 family)
VKLARWSAGGGLFALLLLLPTLRAGGQVPPVPADSPAYLKVWVPAADARLEVDGTLTRQTGTLRQFVSPPLAAGRRYAYTLHLTYSDAGRQVTKTRTVNVEPGREVEVDFRVDVDEPEKKVAPKPAPKPKKVVPPDPDPEPEPRKAPPPLKPAPKPKVVDPDPEPEPKKTAKEDTIVVPYVPTPQEVVEEMLKLGGVKEGDVVYDLGCGDGRIVVTAVSKYKAKRGYGLDLNPERVKDSKETAKKADVEDKVEFKQGDVLKLTEKDLAQADVVTLYLLPEVNKRLRPLLQKALKPGARIVSHDFDMGDWKPEKEIEVKDSDGITHTVYLWTIPGGKNGEPKKAVAPPKAKRVDDDDDLPPKKKATPKKDDVSFNDLSASVVRLGGVREEGESPKTIVVPFVPTPQPVVDEMLRLAGVKEGDVVYDLGCGDGRIVVTAVKKYKAKKGLGIDLNPARVTDSEKTAKDAGVAEKVEFKQGDVLKLKDLSEANVVTLYLLPEVNKRLIPVLKGTLKPGARIVSHDFDMGDWKPEKEIKVVDESGISHRVYLWTIAAKK